MYFNIEVLLIKLILILYKTFLHIIIVHNIFQ